MQQTLDLHIHSKYSRSCSPDLTLENIEAACRVKGVDIIATGDFTFPDWFSDIKNKLIESKPGSGLYKLKSAKDDKVKFILSTEVALIYKDGGKVRRIHLVIHAPNLSAAEELIKYLDKNYNIRSDGRPILGMNAPALMKLCLGIDSKFLIYPAHIWTPWFAVFGSKSGFDAMEECFHEYTKNIYAIETGLSSDPEMNWRLSALDKLTVLSNSDAHSLPNIAREANVFEMKDISYDEIYNVIKNKKIYNKVDSRLRGNDTYDFIITQTLNRHRITFRLYSRHFRERRFLSLFDTFRHAIQEPLHTRAPLVIAHHWICKPFRVHIDIRECDNGDIRYLRLAKRGDMNFRINDNKDRRQLLHMLEPYQELFEAHHFALERKALLLRVFFHRPARKVRFQFLVIFDALPDNLEIRQRPTKPSLHHIKRARLLGKFSRKVGERRLSGDNEYAPPIRHFRFHERRGGFKHFQRFMQVDDIYAVTIAHRKLLHARVRVTLTATKKDPRLHHGFDFGREFFNGSVFHNLILNFGVCHSGIRIGGEVRKVNKRAG